jgi:hypothetical protein
MSRTPGFIFYKLDADGQPKIIQETRISKSPSQLSFRSGRDNSVPSIWKDESKTEIGRAHIPEAVFTQHIESTILYFWSITAIFHVRRGVDYHSGTPILLVSHKGLLIKELRWHREPQCELGLEEFVKCIVIARNNVEERYRDSLVVILSDSEDEISHRRGLVYINETDWIALDNRA